MERCCDTLKNNDQWRNIIMIRTKHKIISVVLCLALMLTAMIAVSLSANAATGDRIYVRLNNGWNKVYCYMWTDNGPQNNQWPGKEMTATSENGVYTYTADNNYQMIIFNNGSGGDGNQTSNINYATNGGDGKIYDLQNGTWSQYVEPTSSGTVPTDPPGSGITVYFKNTKNWSTVKCYMFNSNTDNNGWPGADMTPVGDNTWMYTSSKAYVSCIFDNGSSGVGTNQTKDLTAQDGYVYDMDTDEWTIYDTSPIRVWSYTADPSSALYKGMEINLKATATSDAGAVSYKFSANGTVLRNFAAGNTYSWTPTAAGDYTITYDFKDTAGNTNSRTLDLTVQDDAGVSNPIIKKVTPSADSYIKKGQNSTIKVTAGGGKTGTNLLFYKYIITDPTGAQANTAYYTLNSQYTFKPTKEGVYKIEVHVQASDNSEDVRTYNLVSAENVPTSGSEPTETTEPTTETVPDTTPTTPDEYDLGDVTKDGRVNIKDATYVQLYLVNKHGYETIETSLADFNKDGMVDVKDVTAIQRFVAQHS